MTEGDDSQLLKQTLKITAILLGISVVWVGAVATVGLVSARAASPAPTSPATPASNPASSPASPRSISPADADPPHKRRTG